MRAASIWAPISHRTLSLGRPQTLSMCVCVCDLLGPASRPRSRNGPSRRPTWPGPLFAATAAAAAAASLGTDELMLSQELACVQPPPLSGKQADRQAGERRRGRRQMRGGSARRNRLPAQLLPLTTSRRPSSWAETCGVGRKVGVWIDFLKRPIGFLKRLAGDSVSAFSLAAAAVACNRNRNRNQRNRALGCALTIKRGTCSFIGARKRRLCNGHKPAGGARPTGRRSNTIDHER